MIKRISTIRGYDDIKRSIEGLHSSLFDPCCHDAVDFEKVAYKELQVSGGVGQRRPAWERSLKLMELGVIEAERLVSHDLPLADWARGFEMMEKQEAVKVLLRP